MRWRAAAVAAHSRIVVGRAIAAILCAGVAAALPPVTPPTQPSTVPHIEPASGYFSIADIQGVWWLIDPAGQATVSIGVNNVSYEGDRIHGSGPAPYLTTVQHRYPSRSAWNAAVLRRLRRWGFNTLGAWSDRPLESTMPYTVMLDFAEQAGARWSGRAADVFDPRFEATARAIADREAAPRASDPMLIGYFSDNELWWGGDWRNGRSILAAYLSLPAAAPGRGQAARFLRTRYGTVGRLNAAWHTAVPDFDRARPGSGAAYQADAAAFLAMVALRYFAVSARAIHAADPHHLYLGARFMGLPPLAVLRAARLADAVSINLYVRDPRPQVTAAYAATGRPVLVTEFSFRSLDSGLPNTVGAGPWVFTQRNRAEAYIDYVSRLEAMPAVIGYHWFRWADEPAQGRSDGENSNYGLVDMGDQAYAELVGAAAAANRAAAGMHAGASITVSVPETAPWFRWSAANVINILLGGPRWFSTAIRALAIFLHRTAPAA
jgi:agarase